MDALQSSLLTVKLHALEYRLNRRRRMGNTMSDQLVSHDVSVLRGTPACVLTCARFAVCTKHRDRFLRRLRSRGIDARVHYPSTLSSAPAFHSYGRSTAYPNAEQATAELLSLPCSPKLHDDKHTRLQTNVDAVVRS